MELSLQLQVLIVSFVYGILFSYLIKLQYKYLFNSELFYKIVITVLFVFDNCLLYFLILRAINNGIFHIYFLFSLILGYLFGNYLVNRKSDWHLFCKERKDVNLFDWKNLLFMLIMIIGEWILWLLRRR